MDRVVLLSDDFKQEIKKLGRKRKHIGTDLNQLIRKFDENRLPGKPLKGAPSLSFRSVRMSDKSSSKGPRGGFRVTYKYTCEFVLLLRVVPRKEEDYIAPWRLQRLAEEYACACDLPTQSEIK